MKKIEIINAYKFITEFPIPDEIKDNVENYLNQYIINNNINAYRCYTNYEHGWGGEFFDQWQEIINLTIKLIEELIISEEPISIKLAVL